MSESLVFDSASPRFGLPFLFAGQAQKEVFVNEAHALADALLHCAIEGTLNAPPISPANGANWLVGPAPADAWSGNAGKLACRQGGNWIFVLPRDGMRLLDRSTGQEIRYVGEWKIAVAPEQPTGGSNVDTQARTAIAELLAALEVAGILPTT